MSLPETFVPGFHDEDAVRRMEYIDLGKTGLKVSKLSFGCGALGGTVSYGLYNEEEAIETIREAIRKGINYFDTAPAYGQGTSETVLGKALAGIPRQAYYVSTKVSRYGKDWIDMFNRSEKKIIYGFEHSLKLLGLDYVDIAYVHDVEFGPSDQIIEESLPAVKKLVEKGKVKHIGISAYPVSAIKEVIKKSTVPIEVIISYSRDLIFDQTLQEYLPFFRDMDIGIVNAALTGMGLFTKNGPPAWHPADSKLKSLCAEAVKYAEDKGVDMAKLSIVYSLQQPGSHTYLVGMNCKSNLNDNLNMYYSGLNEREKTVLTEIKEKFFSLEENFQWEGREIIEYKKHVQWQCALN